jgi:hypothetical protein
VAGDPAERTIKHDGNPKDEKKVTCRSSGECCGRGTGISSRTSLATNEPVSHSVIQNHLQLISFPSFLSRVLPLCCVAHKAKQRTTQLKIVDFATDEGSAKSSTVEPKYSQRHNMQKRITKKIFKTVIEFLKPPHFKR